MNISNLIKMYIEQTEKDTGWDIIVYDYFNVVKDDDILNSLKCFGKWHLNRYCLKIKENKSLRRKCTYLKKYFNKKVFCSNGFTKSDCFCGVREYAVPIIVDNTLFGIISAAGFKGRLSCNMHKILAKRCGMTYDEFKQFRTSTLSYTDEEIENRIRTHIQILAFLLKNYITTSTGYKKALSKNSECYHKNKYILTALDYINKNFTNEISISTVANACHISESYLKHLSKDVLGHGISQEILTRRIEYAKELLCTTDFSVKYIALECGFKNTDYFSSAFKNKTGYSPLNYRQLMGKTLRDL